jgi:hypothetical protein
MPDALPDATLPISRLGTGNGEGCVRKEHIIKQSNNYYGICYIVINYLHKMLRPQLKVVDICLIL